MSGLVCQTVFNSALVKEAVGVALHNLFLAKKRRNARSGCLLQAAANAETEKVFAT